MKNRKITPEMLDQILELREKGWSCARIGMKFGTSGEIINWHCLKEGVDSPKNEGKVLPQTCPGPREMKRGNHVVKRFTPEEDERILAMEKDGARTCDIAKALGRRPNSIKGRLYTLTRHQVRKEQAETPGLLPSQ